MTNPQHLSYVDNLQTFDRFFLPIHRQIVEWLGVQQGQKILDAGCGAGGFTLLLAEVGAQVTALDIDQNQVDAARQLIESTPFAQNVIYQAGSVLELPFADNEFDLVWCSRVVHGFPDQLAAARELCRVVKSGGKLALREGGLPMKVLPFDIGMGEPGLEERLVAGSMRWFGRWRQSLNGHIAYPHGWSKMLVETGCQTADAKTFLLEALPPFDAAQSAYVVSRLNSYLQDDDDVVGPVLESADRQTLLQLLDATRPHYVLHRDDLHLRASATVYVGIK